MNITSNGGNIGRIHWINGDPVLSLRERMERYLANKWSVRCPAYGKPPTAPFGRVWWEEGNDQPAPDEWTPAKLLGLASWFSADDGVYVDSETGQRFLRDLSGNGGRMIVAGEVHEVILIDQPLNPTLSTTLSTTTMDTPALLPCPFCGSTDDDLSCDVDEYGRAYVVCGNCATEGPFVVSHIIGSDAAIEQAAAAWNQRIANCRYPQCLENEDERCVEWLLGECKGPRGTTAT